MKHVVVRKRIPRRRQHVERRRDVADGSALDQPQPTVTESTQSHGVSFRPFPRTTGRVSGSTRAVPFSFLNCTVRT